MPKSGLLAEGALACSRPASLATLRAREIQFEKTGWLC